MMVTTKQKDNKIESPKRKFHHTNGYTHHFNFSEDEIEVANTLLNFPFLFSNSNSNRKSKFVSYYHFSYTWASKRRRSALDNPPPPCTVALPLPPPSDSAVRKTPTTSPDTPLAFPTASIKPFTLFKRAKEKLQRMVDERIQTQQTLKDGIEKVKIHLDKLKAENIKLKAQKHKLMEGVDLRREKVHELKLNEQQITVVNDNIPAAPSTSTEFHHQSPLISHQTVHVKPCFRRQIQYHQLGPLGFDLNVSAEEMVSMEMESRLQPLDHRNVMISRAIAAQARHNRIVINKSKKMARGR